MKKQSYFLFLITMLCLAFVGTNSVSAQMTKEGVKIRLFEKTIKERVQRLKIYQVSLNQGLFVAQDLKNLIVLKFLVMHPLLLR